MKAIPKDVATKVLLLDCREAGNVRRLKESLKKLPFIKTDDDLETDNLEQIIKKLETKGKIRLSYIMRSNIDGKELYSGMLKGNTPEVDSKWLKTIHAITIWEVLAKSIFFMTYYIRSTHEEKG